MLETKLDDMSSVREKLFLQEIKDYMEEAGIYQPKLVTGTLRIYNSYDRSSSILVCDNLLLLRTWHQAYVLLEEFEKKHVTNQVEYLCGRIKRNEEQASIEYLSSNGAYTFPSVAKSFTPNDIMIPDADHVVDAYDRFIDVKSVSEVQSVPKEHKKTMDLIRKYYI
ncbi:MAG: hypothetical protein PHN72_06370 [Bacilli bacterium]|nr:hypothetical protein [Bacilli bacterium]